MRTFLISERLSFNYFYKIHQVILKVISTRLEFSETISFHKDVDFSGLFTKKEVDITFFVLLCAVIFFAPPDVKRDVSPERALPPEGMKEIKCHRLPYCLVLHSGQMETICQGVSSRPAEQQ